MMFRTKLIRIAAASLCAASIGPLAAAAQDDATARNLDQASVTYGPYLRLEAGRADVSPEGGYWHPPGYPADPQINFGLAGEEVNFGAIAIGYDWMNGFRGDVSLSVTGTSAIAGPCVSASDGSACSSHADISDASVRTTALMGNVYYSPLERTGSDSRFQPFIVGGIGLARNKVGTWTRENTTLTSGQLRSFEGDTNVELAWSVGLGAAWQITRPGKWPVIVEAAWRYYDYGTARGGAAPVSGSGGVPVTPLSFDNTDQVVSIGVRIPLKRY